MLKPLHQFFAKDICIKVSLCLALIACTKPTHAQFRTKNSGNWASASTWEYVVLGVWVNALGAPSSLSGDVFIQPGHTVTVNNARSVFRLYVNGVLDIQTGGSINIANVLLTPGELAVNAGGELRTSGTNNYSAEIIYGSGSQLHVLNNGKVTVGNGGAVTGTGVNGYATNASNVWDNGAKFEWNSTTAMPLSGLTYFPGAATNVKPVLIVDQPSSLMGGANALLVNGILQVEQNIAFIGAGTKTIRDGITGSGTITVTPGSGDIYLSGAAPILGGRNLQITMDDYFYIPNGLTIPADSSVSVSGFAGASFLGKGSNHFTVNGTIDLGTVTIENPSGAVNINGTIKTSHTGGLEGGSITNSSVVNVNNNSTVEYNAIGNQLITGSTILEGTSPYYNLVFSGSGIKTVNTTILASHNIRISGLAVVDALLFNFGSASATLTMTGGRLQLGAGGLQPVMTGTYAITGGTVQFARNGGPQSIRGGTAYQYHNVEVAGDQVSMNPGDDVYLDPSGIFYVKSTGTLSTNTGSVQGITGTQAFVMETGGTLNCGNEAGFSGALSGGISPFVRSNIESISLATGSTIRYNRAGAQSITNTVPYQHLGIAGTGNKTAPADSVVINGNFSKTGTSVFLHNQGKVNFPGTGGQTFSNTSAFPVVFYNAAIKSTGAGFTVNSDSMAVANELELSPGAKLNLGSGNIILRSDNTGTAQLAKVPAEAGNINYTGTGRFIVERYLPAIKAWRFLSVPVTVASSPSISTAWREGGMAGSNGYGTQITGPAGSVGMDTISPSSSIKWYDMSINNYVPVTNTTATTLANDMGYMIFVRGNRSVGPTGATTTANLRVKGELRTGDQHYTINAQSFLSIGNPYAAPVNYEKMLANSPGLSSYYVAWDPTVSGTYGQGGFQTFSYADGFKANSPSSSFYAPGNKYPNVESGQAFYVYNPTGAPINVTITEDMKEKGSRLAIRENSISDRQFIRSRLYTSNDIIADGNMVAFDDEFDSGYDGDDALKFPNGGENFSLARFGKKLSVELRNRIVPGDSICYSMSNLRERDYKLTIDPENLADLVAEAWFYDRFTGTQVLLKLTDSNQVTFTVNAQAASKAANRFYILFKPMAVLPVNFTSINATRQHNGEVEVKWTVANETNITEYQVERSEDGLEFSTISTITSTGNKNYQEVDKDALATVGFYKIKATGPGNKFYSSPMVKVAALPAEQPAFVFPNPVENNLLLLHPGKKLDGKYQLKLVNPGGQIIFQCVITVGVATSKLEVPVQGVKAGLYEMVLSGKEGTVFNEKVMVR